MCALSSPWSGVLKRNIYLIFLPYANFLHEDFQHSRFDFFSSLFLLWKIVYFTNANLLKNLKTLSPLSTFTFNSQSAQKLWSQLLYLLFVSSALYLAHYLSDLSSEVVSIISGSILFISSYSAFCSSIMFVDVLWR